LLKILPAESGKSCGQLFLLCGVCVVAFFHEEESLLVQSAPLGHC